MRVATFNVLSGRSPGDDHVDARRFGDAVAALDADLLGLQEVDRNQPRSGHEDLTALAAEAMGARHHRFVPALTGPPGVWTPATGDEPPDAAGYGVAFLSRYPVTGWEVVRLPALPVRVPFRWPGSRRPTWVRDEARVAVVAQVESPVGRVRVATTHLSFLGVWNGHQLRVLTRALAADRGPLLLLGDLNMPPGRAHRITGMAPLATGSTFPADRPTRQIDHVLARGAVPAALGGGPVVLPVSDHLALVADLPVA